jgi:hypothetical protein
MRNKPKIQLKNSISKKTFERIGKYSVLVGASLSTLISCDVEDDEIISKINYTNLNPDINLIPLTTNWLVYGPGLRDFIDLNNDGIDDVEVNVFSYKYLNFASSYTYSLSSIDYNGRINSKGLNNAKLLGSYQELPDGFRPWFIGFSDGYVVSGLNEEDEISNTQNIWRDSGNIAMFFSKVIPPPFPVYDTIKYGEFFNLERFIGVQLPIEGRNHFGWIRVQVNIDGTALKIRDYAYHIEPEETIKAGEY